uniref:Uncharacterized protein n=1 Tax=viral metagenome TaxID=1070528 RepID=A0A6C0L0M0_9ZZZZ|tara:strand:- start:14806 stop:15231 length:426 start_codon:yes stop_codon:yes gene_type:complete
MENNFVSDISNEILNNYNTQKYEQIYDAIDANITKLTNDTDYDSAYRLQQDIVSLNTMLLSEISKYINTNVTSDVNGEQNKSKQDTFKQQSESTKVNLTYKYVYVIVKFLVILILLIFVYFKLIVSNDNSKSPFGKPKLIT